MHPALLCTECLPSIYGLTLIKPQSIGLNRWDLYWLNTLRTKINSCSIDLLAMKISSHQHALTKITKLFFSEQHWSNQVDKPCCSLMIVNLLSSKKFRWSLWVLYVDHYIFCRLDFHQENSGPRKKENLQWLSQLARLIWILMQKTFPLIPELSICLLSWAVHQK